MKKVLFLAMIGLALTVTANAQNGKGKAPGKAKENKEWQKERDDDEISRDKVKKEGREDKNKDVLRQRDNEQKSMDAKNSKNIPAKVREAFNRDYPNATNVTWTKSRGNWTAKFGGILGQNSVTYHANGQRVTNATTSQTTPIRKAIDL